jgi:hypothetical protein
MAWSDHCRGVSNPRGARVSSHVTAPAQRLTTPAKMCPGVASRSVQKTASMGNCRSGSQTRTTRMATGGNRGVSQSAVCEQTHHGFRFPPYQPTAAVSQGVSERSAQPCTRRWRVPFQGVGPRLPGSWGPGQ